jgi:hypothetical protein
MLEQTNVPEERFANRSILTHLGWLDVSTWPLDASALTNFGVVDVKAIFDHWQSRFQGSTWDQMVHEFDQVKTIYKTMPDNP